MRRAITVSVIVLVSAIAAAQGLRNAAARPAPSFVGKWELAGLELKPLIHRNGHIHPQTAPRVRPMTMTVTQEPDSITIRTDVLDSLRSVVAASVSRTYRSRLMSTSGPEMRIDRRKGTLELVSVVPGNSRQGSDDPTTSTETWRLGPDGTLERRVHDESAQGILDRTETWRRLASR